MPRVLIADELSPRALAIFRERGVEADVNTGLSPDKLIAVIGDYEGLAVRSATKVTAKVLAAAIKSAGPDLVLTATESSDGYTGTVPEQIAALLGLPSITFAKEVHIDGQTVSVRRQTEAGYDEVTCPLPAVVSVTAGVVEPRYPSFKGIMAAKSKPVEAQTVAGLGLDPAQVGAAGAGQEIVAVEDAPTRDAGEIIEDDGEAFGKIVSFLDGLKVI